MKKQMGGTLLGLVIGALIGLGAALAVAVYVTKVPVPFMNKSQARNPDHDANEAKKNQNWDPNAPLAGRNARPPAPAASGLVTAPASGLPLPGAAVPTPTAPVAAASSPRAARPAAASADPLGDLARERTEGTAANGVDPFSYFIQVGAFRTPEDAEQQRARLLLLGFQARVTEREQSGRTVYRVRLGPYDKKDDADKAKDRLDSNSIETALVRVQR
ncbi:MAG: sporulation protein [Comamonadaceae bacterium]|nr:MAG: sporulation protein [Comamonadaceae bacterium]